MRTCPGGWTGRVPEQTLVNASESVHRVCRPLYRWWLDQRDKLLDDRVVLAEGVGELSHTAVME